MIDKDTVGCTADLPVKKAVKAQIEDGSTMSTAQLAEAESLTSDGAMQRAPEQAGRIARAARQSAAELGNGNGDLALIRRFTSLAEKLERIGRSA